MTYTKTNPFGATKSKGNFDDFFDTDKYADIQDAYAADDFVIANYVKDEHGTLFIEAYHVKEPTIKKYHQLTYQNPIFGIDVLDDSLACEMAGSLI